MCHYLITYYYERSAKGVLRDLVEKSNYERPGPTPPDTTRHDTTRAYISATAGPFHVRSPLMGSYIPSAVNPGALDPSGY